jgi:hypothetical protein
LKKTSSGLGVDPARIELARTLRRIIMLSIDANRQSSEMFDQFTTAFYDFF